MRSLIALAVCGLGACAVPAAAQTAWAPECRLHRVAALPMTAAGSVVTVPVAINGVQKNFLVDTGGYASSINQRVADEMQLTPHDIVFNRIRDAGGKEATKYVWADSFRLGAMEAKKFDLMVSETGNPRIDGVLSPDLLRNFDLDFDFASMTLSLFRPHPCDGHAVYWTKDFIALPMELTKDGHTRVEVTVDGQTMDAILDTGAAASVMTFGSAARFFSACIRTVPEWCDRVNWWVDRAVRWPPIATPSSRWRWAAWRSAIPI